MRCQFKWAHSTASEVIQRKKTFTLLELLVCVAIAALAIGIVSKALFSMVRAYQFERSVKKVQQLLEEMQIYALILGSDFSMQLEFYKGKWRAVPRSEEPRLQFSPLQLEGIETVLWEQPRSSSLLLHIDSSGRIDPPQLIHFQRENHRCALDLRFPLLIKIIPHDSIPTKAAEF